MIRPEGLLRGSFLVLDLDPRLDLSFFREGRCRCQAQRDMIADNMEKEITITRMPYAPAENAPEIQIIDDTPNGRVCRKSWAKLIYQVYEVDPLKCPKCGARMKIIAFITAREEIIKIQKHLAMWPIVYPENKAAEARASPLGFKLLEKFSVSFHLK